MRILILLVFLLGWEATYSYGQSKQSVIEQIDSLKSLTQSATDSALADAYNEISWIYRNIDIDTSIFYAKKALELSSELSYFNGINQSLNYLGVAYRNISNYSKALELFFEGLRSSEQSNDVREISYSLINIGNIYVFQTNYEGALEYFQRALENAKIIHNNDIIAYCYLNIGRSYAGMKDLEKAEENFLIAKQIRSEEDDQEGLIRLNSDLAKLYISRNQTKKAKQLLLDNVQKANEYLLKNTLSETYLYLAEVHIMLMKLDQAKEYLNLSLEISRALDFRKTESEAIKLFSVVYEKSKNYDLALNYFKQYVDQKDSIFNEENTRKIETLHSQYEAEKSEVEKKHLREQTQLNEIIIKRQKAIIALSIVASLLFLMVAVIALWSSNERKKLNAQIEEQKEQAYKHNNDLIDINNEKNNLIRILSHDLRAPINNIKGLTEIHQTDHKADFSESENQVLDLIKSESDRILTMISKILNVEALRVDSKKINAEEVNVTQIMDEIFVSFSNAAQSKKIKVEKLYSDKQYIIMGDSVHLHQVLENLLSNALKFSKSDTTIKLGLEAINQSIQISIEDEGPGLTADDKDKIFKKFQTLSAKPTANEVSTGLGLSIVKKYVEQMDGKIWYESELNKGTKFIVQFELV